jgi:hypothetical protein
MIKGKYHNLSKILNIENGSFTLKIKNKYTADFEYLKTKVVSFAFEHFDKRRTKCSLEEFYCNPYKDSSLIKLKYPSDMDPVIGSLIDITISIKDVWIAKKSFGPVCELKKCNITSYDYNFVNRS